MCCCEIVHDAIIGLEDVMVGYLFGKKRATEVAHSYVFASSANYFLCIFTCAGMAVCFLLFSGLRSSVASLFQCNGLY